MYASLLDGFTSISVNLDESEVMQFYYLDEIEIGPLCRIGPVIGEILGTTGWDPSVCKSNRLHVEIVRFSFIKLGYIL